MCREPYASPAPPEKIDVMHPSLLQGEKRHLGCVRDPLIGPHPNSIDAGIAGLGFALRLHRSQISENFAFREQ